MQNDCFWPFPLILIALSTMLSNRLEARDMHVTTLLKKSERAARRKAIQDARERNSQAIRFPMLDASFIGALYIYIYIYMQFMHVAHDGKQPRRFLELPKQNAGSAASE